ncbi:MAG: ABC transporter permease, partial [bacterium]
MLKKQSFLPDLFASEQAVLCKRIHTAYYPCNPVLKSLQKEFGITVDVDYELHIYVLRLSRLIAGVDMLKHYLKIATRNILKYKTYSFINVFGLAVGIACCILVFLFVQDELQFDRFYENRDQIYRVNLQTKTPAEGIKISAGQPPPLAPMLKTTYPEIQYATRFKSGSAVIRTSPENASKENILYADNDVLKMFDFPLRSGDASTALAQVDKIILVESKAQKYFGDETPLGKTITLDYGDTERDFVISGVAHDLPKNSSIQFDFLLPYESAPNYKDLENSWTAWGAVTFIQLSQRTRPKDLQAKFGDFVDTYYQDMINTWQILGWLAKEEGALQLALQPLKSIYLTPHVEKGLFPTSNPANSFILFGIGMIVLLIACINFTTLSIGRAMNRTMEVGMRKTLGANRIQLMRQFWGEAMLFSLLALLLGIALVEGFLPFFNTLANKSLSIEYFENWHIPAIFAGLILLVGIMAGSYPAVFLSRFQPVQTLKSRILSGRKNRTSQILVVVQFSLSVLLITCALIMSRQLRWLKSQDPGFNKEQVVVIPTHARGEKADRILLRYKSRLLGQSNILGVTGNSDGFRKAPAWKSFGRKDSKNWQVNIMRVDHDFIETLEMEIVAGRNFSRQLTSDSMTAVIVNKALVIEMGWQQPLQSEQIFQDFNLGPWNKPIMQHPSVVGVVRDFNYASLHESVKPLVMYLAPVGNISYLFVRIKPGDFGETIALLRDAWREIAPGSPFDYFFLDENFDRHYRAEERWLQIVSYSTMFAIVIACIGLFGLSALSVTKRTK